VSYSFPRQFAIVLDQVANVLTGGWADETLSARAYRAYAKGRKFGLLFLPLIDALFAWQSSDAEVNRLAGREITGHCERAFYKEILRRDNSPEYR
jgi:hypothetical protein